MDGKIFERCFVWVVCQKAAELTPPKNNSDLANEAFLDTGHPVNAWRSVRNGVGGKFRSLSMEEACNLAHAIGIPFPQLCWDVSNHIRSGWSLTQDVSLQKSHSGRPAKKANITPENAHPSPPLNKVGKIVAIQQTSADVNAENT